MTDISSRTTRKHLALGRCQAFADLERYAHDQLLLAVRSAKACGATHEELRVETGLTQAGLKRALAAPRRFAGAA